MDVWGPFILFAVNNISGASKSFYISCDIGDEEIVINGLKKKGERVLLDYQNKGRYISSKGHLHIPMTYMIDKVFSFIR